MNNNKLVSRRDFLKLLKIVTLQTFALGILGYAYGAEVEIDRIEVSNVRLKLRRLNRALEGIKLVQISDAHLGFWMNKKRLDQVIDRALAERPDTFILTGDFVEGHPTDMSKEESIAVTGSSFARLSEVCPTFAVLGNHDYVFNSSVVAQSLSQVGISVLQNSITTIKRDHHELHIAGVDDVHQGKDQLDKVLMELPESGAAILLVHEPDFADTTAGTGRFDLQLSGHSHGGQIVLPYLDLGPLFLPGYGQKYPSGLYNVNDIFLYTNRGVGVTGMKARLNCRPEITVFTLESA